MNERFEREDIGVGKRVKKRFCISKAIEVGVEGKDLVGEMGVTGMASFEDMSMNLLRLG